VRPRAAWRRNLGLKTLSVLLALLLWAYVHGARTIEHEIELPVHGINLPDSLLLAGPLPRTARVLVAGPAQEIYLHRLVPQAALRLDLSRARPPGVKLVPLPADCVLGSREHLHVLRILEPSIVDVAVRRRTAGHSR
jgi:hypothetical protein